MGQGTAILLLALVAGSAPESPATAGRFSLPDRCLGLRMQPLLLLSRADVRADIGLDEQQAGDVDKAIFDFVARAATARGAVGPALVEARRAIDVEAKQWLETHLSEQQYRRLIQVDLQWEGPSSLISRPVIAEHLELTPDQRQAIEAALAARNQQRKAYDQAFMAQNKNRLPDAYPQEIELTFAKKAAEILSAKQRQLWSDMAGQRFNPRLTPESAHSTARPAQ